MKMRGVVARRRITQFGWRYFESFKLTRGAEPPRSARAVASGFA
jgi:hypothetical protein